MPTLRLVTQAGGRLEPDRVRSWAERGAREGWDLRVMYGQTEATARMAISAPGAAARHPSSVGMPVGEGRFSVRGADGELPVGEVGELHYSGHNVMLGYADEPGDLARGRTVGDLATGDLARIRPDGSLEIVGRRSSFLKVNGVRLDVEHVERLLAGEGLPALVGGSDERLLALVVADGSTRARADVVDRATHALVAPHRAAGPPRGRRRGARTAPPPQRQARPRGGRPHRRADGHHGDEPPARRIGRRAGRALRRPAGPP